MFSVCIATYMRPYMISKVIESVLNQTYTDFELLIHDDSTNDETEKIVKTFTDSRIKYKRNVKNLGIFKNFNSLINASSREYVKFLNDDDTLLPNCLEVTADKIKLFEKKYNKKPSLITLSAQYVDDKNEIIKQDNRKNAGGLMDYYIEKENIPLLWYMDAVPVRTPTHSLYLTESVKELGGFDESLLYNGDVELGYRLSMLGGNLILDKDPLINFQMHEKQLGNSMSFETKVYEQEKLKNMAYNDIINKNNVLPFKEIFGEIVLREIALMFKYKAYKSAFKGMVFWFKNAPFAGINFFIKNNIIHTKKFYKYCE